MACWKLVSYGCVSVSVVAVVVVLEEEEEEEKTKVESLLEYWFEKGAVFLEFSIEISPVTDFQQN